MQFLSVQKCKQLTCLKETLKNLAFIGAFPRNLGDSFAKILRQFLRRFKIIILQELLKIIFWNFGKILDFSEGALEKLLDNFQLILEKFWKNCRETLD